MIDGYAPTWAQATGREATALEVLNEWWANEDNHDMNLDEWIDAQAQLHQGDAYDSLANWEAIALTLATGAACERLHGLTKTTSDSEELREWLIALAIDGPGLGAW